MDKDERRAFRLGVLSGVAGNALWSLLLASAAVLGAVAKWYHGLTDFGQGISYTLSAVLLFLACAAVIYRYIAVRRLNVESPAVPSPPPPATPPKTATPNTRISAKIRDIESVRIHAVLRGLSIGALNELETLLATDPPESRHINMELLNLLNSGLISSAGQGSNFGECVFYVQPAAEDTIREFFKERAAKRRLAATVKTDKDKT